MSHEGSQTVDRLSRLDDTIRLHKQALGNPDGSLVRLLRLFTSSPKSELAGALSLQAQTFALHGARGRQHLIEPSGCIAEAFRAHIWHPNFSDQMP